MAHEPERRGQKNGEGEKPQRASPMIVRVLRALKRRYHARKRHYGKEQTDERMARWTRNVGWFTLALVVVGIVTASIFEQQLGVMEGTLKEMRDSFRADQAYLFLFQTDRNRGAPMTPDYAIAAHFKNFGRTPALLYEAGGSCKYFAVPPPPNLEFTTTFQFGHIIGEGDETGPLPGAVRAAQSEIDQAKLGNGSIRCIYNLRFRDVRDGDHLAGICLIWNFGISAFLECPEKQYRYKQ